MSKKKEHTDSVDKATELEKLELSDETESAKESKIIVEPDVVETSEPIEEKKLPTIKKQSGDVVIDNKKVVRNNATFYF